MAREGAYQAGLIKKIKKMLPDCMVLKNDSSYLQGVPDILILNNSKWGCLEVKRSKSSPRQPNQEYYVNKMNDMSFSSFIYPENERQVLDDLQRALS